ncbi:hypothetical protein PV325_010998 [Microctonus aethiopoides]|uniref:Ribosomal protein L7Ae/L30e/S12e/Gadd45 domain-containing protein n=1 Tax=Microctonus aethiopoides TaxID=144406 RepID=A0AA39FN80_9HYME|nr:hypothetical protein PV325_010998 [Microctonus aethiopoides]KAK0172536.1 hypothetical protein PV328_005842 [Microctonus aethiopoides]
MSTPKNQVQQSTALSTIKKGPLKGLKNVLVQPQEILWPILREEKEKNALHSLLTELLPMKKYPAKKMNWAKLCKLSKEERAALKNDSQAKSSEETGDNTLVSVVLGINSVTRALEKNSLCSILVDSNVEPLFMIKHIVTMSQNKEIPVLLIPFLKTVTLNKIGFASAALGIKKSVLDISNENFYKLHEKIVTLVDAFPRNKTSIQLFSMDEQEINSKSNVEDLNSMESSETVDNICNATQNTSISKCVYKYRSSCKERAFIPPESQPISVDESKPESKPENPWSEFIALGADNENDSPGLNGISQTLRHVGRYMDIHQSDRTLSENKVNSNNIKSKKVKNIKVKSNDKNIDLTTYVPLKVKRIQGNPKRLKATKTAKSKKKIPIKK